MSTDQATDKEARPTPVSLVARLTLDPGAPPVGLTVFPEATLGSLLTGAAIGIAGRWYSVERCTLVNGWSSVETPPYCPPAEGYWDVPIYLARKIEENGDG